MRRSTILFSCARFIMLSLNGARQISGKRVRMSIFIVVAAVCDRRSNYATLIERRYRLFDDLEGGALAVTRRRAVQHSANGMNGLAVATDDAADVALAKLDFEDRHPPAQDFRQHHVVGKFDQLANDELEKFFHW